MARAGQARARRCQSTASSSISVARTACSERGMGSAVGQDPDLIEAMTSLDVKEAAQRSGDREADPEHHRHSLLRARGCARRRRRDLADQHDQQPDGRRPRHVEPDPARRRQERRTAAIAGRRSSRSRSTWSATARAIEVDVPISGIGGIANWRDAVEFMLMGATNVQVCTAVMHDGFRIVGRHDRGPQQLSRRARHRLGRARSSARHRTAFVDLERTSTSTTRSSPTSTRRRASTAVSAGSPARTRRTSASTALVDGRGES